MYSARVEAAWTGPAQTAMSPIERANNMTTFRILFSILPGGALPLDASLRPQECSGDLHKDGGGARAKAPQLSVLPALELPSSRGYLRIVGAGDFTQGPFKGPGEAAYLGCGGSDPSGGPIGLDTE